MSNDTQGGLLVTHDPAPVPITKNLMTMYKKLKEHEKRKIVLSGLRTVIYESTMSSGVELLGIPHGEEREQEQGMEAEALSTKAHGLRKYCAFWKLSGQESLYSTEQY